MTEAARQEAIDLAFLASQTDGDEALARELLDLFSRQCAQHLVTIGGEGSLRERREATHTLKGAASAVGASRVADAATAVEAALSGGNGAGLAPALAELAAAVAAARDFIARRGHDAQP